MTTILRKRVNDCTSLQKASADSTGCDTSDYGPEMKFQRRIGRRQLQLHFFILADRHDDVRIYKHAY